MAKIAFDFSNVGRQWRREWIRKASEMSEAADGDLEKMMQIDDELLPLAIQVVKSVPKSLLTNNAPDVLDWSDPDSLEYLRANVNITAEVSQALNESTGN